MVAAGGPLKKFLTQGYPAAPHRTLSQLSAAIVEINMAASTFDGAAARITGSQSLAVAPRHGQVVLEAKKVARDPVTRVRDWPWLKAAPLFVSSFTWQTLLLGHENLQQPRTTGWALVGQPGKSW